jgi:redox-sensitive bicupin YhaK (pirin superfamily)
MRGFQLWVNLPARLKMSEPGYQEFPPERIPVAHPVEGVSVKVIAGRVADADGADVIGPIVQPATEPLYFDIDMAPGRTWALSLPEGHNAFVFVFEGALSVGEGDDARPLPTHTLGVLGGGERATLAAGDSGARAILVAGRPLREPVAKYGPFVMNTKEEIMQAFVDYQEGRF